MTLQVPAEPSFGHLCWEWLKHHPQIAMITAGVGVACFIMKFVQRRRFQERQLVEIAALCIALFEAVVVLRHAVLQQESLETVGMYIGGAILAVCAVRGLWDLIFKYTTTVPILDRPPGIGETH